MIYSAIHFALRSDLLAFWSPGPAEMMLLLVVALLLYGGKLPEVARTWGKTFADFRRSFTGIQHEFNDAMYSVPEQLEYRDDSTQPDGYGDCEDDSIPDDSIPDDSIPDESIQDESIQDESIQDESSKDESSKDDSSKDDSTAGELTEEQSSNKEEPTD